MIESLFKKVLSVPLLFVGATNLWVEEYLPTFLKRFWFSLQSKSKDTRSSAGGFPVKYKASVIALCILVLVIVPILIARC